SSWFTEAASRNGPPTACRSRGAGGTAGICATPTNENRPNIPESFCRGCLRGAGAVVVGRGFSLHRLEQGAAPRGFSEAGAAIRPRAKLPAFEFDCRGPALV